MNPDTDGDGISNGDEVFGQTKVQDVQTQDEAITEVVVDMDTAHDAANSTVSTTTTHFSQYMVVDSVKWFENWDNSLNKLREMWGPASTTYGRLSTIFVVEPTEHLTNHKKCNKQTILLYKSCSHVGKQLFIFSAD